MLTHQVFHALRSSCQNELHGHRGRPPSRCPAGIRDRSVTAGALSPRTTTSHGCQIIACVRTSPPNRSNCPRWRASEYCSAKAGRSRAFPSRCVLRSVTHCGPTLSRTPTRASPLNFRVDLTCARRNSGMWLPALTVLMALPRAPSTWTTASTPARG
jgi:hypothetical protein